MKRWLIAAILIAILIFATAATAFAKGGPPGPGNSHNGNCTGQPGTQPGNSWG